MEDLKSKHQQLTEIQVNLAKFKRSEIKRVSNEIKARNRIKNSGQRFNKG